MNSNLEGSIAAPVRPLGRGLGDVRLWALLASLFSLSSLGGPYPPPDASALWFLELVVVQGFLIGLLLRFRRGKARAMLPVGRATALFIVLSWLTGMLYELSLSSSAGNFGGMHPDTATSFTIAQAFYIPYAVLGWWLVRRYRYTFRELFFAAGLVSVYEMSQNALPAFASAPLLAPILIAYYFTVYALILCMPLLFFDERSLWSDSGVTISTARKLFYGVLLGIASFSLFVLWGGLILA